MSGREVLLTGATGFVGKVVLEALLRRREALGIERVHVLVRPGAGGDAGERFAKEVAASPCFARLAPGWEERVAVVVGDVVQPGCAVAPEARRALAERVTHILHVAASVEFDMPLADAFAVNVGGCLHVLELAREAQRLERMVTVSTAYVTPHPGDGVPVRETLAPLPRPAAEIRDEILAGRADEQALLRETGHPNTYTLTKCLAEHLLVDARGGVPLHIVRPSVVSASWREPFPGWIDSGAAFAGFVALVGTGHLRAVVARPESKLDLVPVDVVAERVLAAGFGELAAPGVVPTAAHGVPITYAIVGLAASPTIDQCRAWLVDFFRRHPVDRRPAVPYLGLAGKRYRVYDAFFHELLTRLGAGRSERARRAAARLRARIRNLNTAFPYFTRHTFDFRSATPPAEPPPPTRAYVEMVCRGIYRNLLRRDEGEVPLAGRRGPAHGGDLRFAAGQPQGNAALRATGWLVTKVLRRAADVVSFDLASFERARCAVPEGTAVVLAPSHRSYLDFVLCSYLCFARPDLGFAIPHIAAAIEFSRIPLLGRLFGSLQAFYLERGLGREEKALTQQVSMLVRERKTLEFFIEGGRSRARTFLEPKRGFLRALQSTGAPVAIVPIAFSYDRVPEEISFVRELGGGAKPPMQLGGLLAWTWRLLRGRIRLGRVHVACGAPVPLDLARDVREVCRDVMAELQRETVATTFHLRTFLAREKPEGVSARALAEAIRARGGRVLDSPLGTDTEVHPHVAAAVRYHFEHVFYPEARALYGAHPVVAAHLERSDYGDAPAREVAQGDALAPAVVAALFAPICRDHQRVVAELGDPARPLAFETPRTLLRAAPELHLPNVEAAYADLARRAVLDRRGDRYAWGPRAAELAECWALYAWPHDALATARPPRSASAR